jgi:cysteine synthase
VGIVMRVCGVELKGNDAIICLMSLTDGLYALHECRIKKLSVNDASDSQQLKKFQFDFVKLMSDYQVERVVIRERMTKGKFAGGSVGFKLEAAIQLADDLNVSLLSSSKMKEIIKNSRVVMNFHDTGLKQFQEQAFMTAFSYLEGG